MSRIRRLLLVALALALGGVAAWRMVPRWREHRALQMIASIDPQRRASGWAWLLSGASAAHPPLPGRLRRITASLAGAPDDAVLDGADALRPLRCWGWDSQPADLVLREVALRAASSEEAQQRLAVRAVDDGPLEAPLEDLEPIFIALLASPHAPVRSSALEAAIAWAGPERIADLPLLPERPEDSSLRRLLLLAQSWAPDAACAPIMTAEAPLEEREAALLCRGRHEPDDAEEILALAHAGAAEPLEYILRFSADPRALRFLEAQAASGSDAAAYALQARVPHRDDEAARQVLADPAQPPWRCRLAAWRWDRVPVARVRDLLEEEPAEPDGHVYAAALLAERRLPRAEAARLAESWIRNYSDDFKRAGALLAALLGVHQNLLREACQAEDIPAVRTTQRLALMAMGQPIGPEDPLEFAYRALHDDAGDFDADTILCLLLAGHTPALQWLTMMPEEDPPLRWTRSRIQCRAWLIERFAPDWFARAGRPIGGDQRTVQLHFDSLSALWHLERRRLRHDPRTRMYRVPGDVDAAVGSDSSPDHAPRSAAPTPASAPAADG